MIKHYSEIIYTVNGTVYSTQGGGETAKAAHISLKKLLPSFSFPSIRMYGTYEKFAFSLSSP